MCVLEAVEIKGEIRITKLMFKMPQIFNNLFKSPFKQLGKVIEHFEIILLMK